MIRDVLFFSASRKHTMFSIKFDHDHSCGVFNVSLKLEKFPWYALINVG